MARYIAYENNGGQGYLLAVQSDLLDGLNTCVVVPLLELELAPKPAERLNPVFEIKNKKCVMVTQYLAAIPRQELQNPVAEIVGYEIEISAALDMLFQGF